MHISTFSVAIFTLCLLLQPSIVVAIPSYAHQPLVFTPHHGTCLNEASHSHPLVTLKHWVERSIWRFTLKSSKAHIPEKTHHNSRTSQKAGLEDIVLRFNVSTAKEVLSLAEATDTLFLDVWEATGNWVDIRLPLHVVPNLLGLLPESLHHAHAPLFGPLELAQAIADTYPAPSSSGSFHVRRVTPVSRSTAHQSEFFQEYRPYSVFVPWMRLMSAMFSTHVRIISIGKSFEGRDIPALRIGTHPNPGMKPMPRKTVLITAGSHGREWISTSTATYIAWSLIMGYGRDVDMTELLEHFDFVIVPSINPDGYVYSWDVDRMWRKNRQSTPITFCHGIDLDRTWDFMWDASSSDNPCSESYAGSAPLEAVEAQILAAWTRNEMENNNVTFAGFVDLHSYSQQILLPYSFSCNEFPPTLEDLEELGEGLAKAIRMTNGEEYAVIRACKGNVINVKGSDTPVTLPRIESAGGNPLDYFYSVKGVRKAFQIKLRDNGSYGFLLPSEYIIPTGQEALDAILYLGKSLLQESTMTGPSQHARQFHHSTQKPL